MTKADAITRRALFGALPAVAAIAAAPTVAKGLALADLNHSPKGRLADLLGEALELLNSQHAAITAYRPGRWRLANDLDKGFVLLICDTPKEGSADHPADAIDAEMRGA